MTMALTLAEGFRDAVLATGAAEVDAAQAMLSVGMTAMLKADAPAELRDVIERFAHRLTQRSSEPTPPGVVDLAAARHERITACCGRFLEELQAETDEASAAEAMLVVGLVASVRAASPKDRRRAIDRNKADLLTVVRSRLPKMIEAIATPVGMTS